MSDPTATSPLPEQHRKRRGHQFYPPKSVQVPPMRAQEDTKTGDQIIHLHYFGGSADWWITELDRETGEAFGYACLGDPHSAEWGYIWLPEIEGTLFGPLKQPFERDLHWQPKTVREAKFPGRNGGIFDDDPADTEDQG